MQKPILLFITTLLIGLAGCGQSLKIAKESYDRGTQANEDTRHAFFVKAWGLNRAVITEARLKWMNEAIIAVLKARSEAKISAESAEVIIRKFESELGKDEVVASENFAYLAFLLLAGERGDEMLGNVDFYLGAQEPIWKAGSHELQGEAKDAMKEAESWKPILGDLKKALPKSLIDKLGLGTTSQPG